MRKETSRLLIAKIRAIELRHTLAAPESAGFKNGRAVSTGWPEIDSVLEGGLLGGALHEWFGPESIREPGDVSWAPPVCIPLHLAWRALETGCVPLWLVWVGRRCFPYPGVLVREDGRDRRMLERSIFVSPRDTAKRLWAMDLALRCPAVGVVIADGSRFDMAATRRVQLVAKTHDTLALLVRPPWERAGLSAAQTRWQVTWEPRADCHANPRWSVELLRCKGVQPAKARGRWVLEWDHASSTMRLSAQVAHPAGAAKTSQRSLGGTAYA